MFLLVLVCEYLLVHKPILFVNEVLYIFSMFFTSALMIISFFYPVSFFFKLPNKILRKFVEDINRFFHVMTAFIFPKKLAIGSDHAGFELKEALLPFLRELGFDVKDFGAFSEDRVDYPDVAHPLATAIEQGDFPCGILICGSGQGVNITANKHQGIRSALVWNAEIAALSRGHNNANVLALPARFMDVDTAKACILAFLSTPFEGGRHADRVAKMGCL